MNRLRILSLLSISKASLRFVYFRCLPSILFVNMLSFFFKVDVLFVEMPVCDHLLILDDIRNCLESFGYLSLFRCFGKHF